MAKWLPSFDCGTAFVANFKSKILIKRHSQKMLMIIRYESSIKYENLLLRPIFPALDWLPSAWAGADTEPILGITEISKKLGPFD